jgi:hypothetical protein
MSTRGAFIDWVVPSIAFIARLMPLCRILRPNCLAAEGATGSTGVEFEYVSFEHC